MSESRPYQIVVAYDFSASAEYALERAVAHATHQPCMLHIVAALGSRGGLSLGTLEGIAYESTADRIQEAITERVRDTLTEYGLDDSYDFHVHARIGRPADEILGLAKDVGADVIFVGSHGRTGVHRLLMGSVSEHVVREARCPVMVIRAKTYEDVDLVKVVPYEHARATYTPPHRFGYGENRVVMRPTDWPLS